MKNKWLNFYKFVILPAHMLCFIFSIIGILNIGKNYYELYQEYSLDFFIIIIPIIILVFFTYYTYRVFISLYRKEVDSIKKNIKYLCFSGSIALLLNLFINFIGNNYSINTKGLVIPIVFSIAYYGLNLYYFNNRIDIYENKGKEVAIDKKRKIKKNVVSEENIPEILKKYKELLDDGIITQDEFNKKKKELLD